MSQVIVSTYVFNKVKIKAKKLKKSHPALSHMQRLDLASKEIASKRHHHEVQKLHKHYLDKCYFSHDLTTYTCPLCSFNFCPDIIEDRVEHQATHRRWEMLEYVSEAPLLNRTEREKLKQIGYKRIANHDDSFSKDEVIEGGYMLLKAYFNRSLESALLQEQEKHHPNFKDYIALASHEKVFPKALSSHFRKKYGTKVPSIEKYWFPA